MKLRAGVTDKTDGLDVPKNDTVNVSIRLQELIKQFSMEYLKAQKKFEITTFSRKTLCLVVKASHIWNKIGYNALKYAPNLDVTVTRKYIREQVKSTINNPSEEVGVKTKTLNLWCDSAEVWLPDTYLVKASKKIDQSRFKDLPCYVGVDLTATSDLTAVSYLVVDDDKYYFRTDYYLPESALREKADRELYKYWKQMELLKITDGNVTDYDYITQDILKAAETVNIQTVGYDPYNSTQWAIDATSLGINLTKYPQNLGNFNKPTRELERLILSGKTVIENNEITRFCFQNVLFKSNYNGNVKPNKAVDKKKIDGVIAMIQALGCYLLVPHYSNEIISI